MYEYLVALYLTCGSVRHIGKNGDGGHKFAIAGAHKGVQGVGISVNSGEIFKTFDAGLSTAARYGAFPTDDIWYAWACLLVGNAVQVCVCGTMVNK